MGRGRCPTHGLVIGDAGCLRCEREDATRAKRSLPLGKLLVGLVALVLGGMVVARAASALGDRPSASTLRPDPAPVAVATGTAAGMATAPAPEGTRESAATNDSRESLIAAEMSSVPVTLYAANYCPWCRKAKAHMDSRGIAYTELHIDEDPSAKREMARIGGHGIPTIDIEGEVHSGYDPAWVERTVRAHAARRVAPR